MKDPFGPAVMLLGFAGFFGGGALLIAFEVSAPLAGTEAVCRIAKAAKSGNCMQYVVVISGNSSSNNGDSGNRGVVNGDGRVVTSGIMVIPTAHEQIGTVAWDNRGRGDGGGNVTCFVYTHRFCPMQKGYWPHQLNEGCCPRNDANEGGAQGTWIYKDKQMVRSERRWFPVLGAGLVVLGLLLICVGRLMIIGFGFAYVMRWLGEESDAVDGSCGGGASEDINTTKKKKNMKKKKRRAQSAEEGVV